jgi:hypothetical protein
LRREIKQMIREEVLFSKQTDDDLEVFTLSNNNQQDFIWVESHEFRFKGMLYDVVKQHLNEKGETILYCFRDDKEHALIQSFECLLSLDKDPLNSNRSPLVQLFKILNAADTGEQNYMYKLLPVIIKRSCLHSEFYAFLFSRIELPPPKLS